MSAPNKIPGGVRANSISANNLKDNKVSQVIYRDYLPEAPAAGSFVRAPESEVVGSGLEAI